MMATSALSPASFANGMINSVADLVRSAFSDAVLVKIKCLLCLSRLASSLRSLGSAAFIAFEELFALTSSMLSGA